MSDQQEQGQQHQQQQQQADYELVVDIWWTFVLPGVCVLSILANAFNVLIFFHLRPSKEIYKLLFAKALINVLYLFVCFWKFVSKCGRFCALIALDKRSTTIQFAIQLYDFFAFGILAHILGLSDMLVEIFISIKRFHLLSDERRRHHTRMCRVSVDTIVVAIVCFAALVYVPDSLFARVHLDDQGGSQNSTYRLEIVEAELYRTMSGAKFLVFRSTLMLSLLVFINWLNCYQMRSRVRAMSIAAQRQQGEEEQEQEQQQEEEEKRQRSKALVMMRPANMFNSMLLYQSLVYMAGNSLFFASFVVSLVDKSSGTRWYTPMLYLLINTLLFMSLGLNALVYLVFDKRFRQRSRTLFSSASVFTRD